MKKIQELQNEVDNIQMRLDAIMGVYERSSPTTCEAGAMFELEASVSEFTAMIFLSAYYGLLTVEHYDDCIGFATGLGHVGTYNSAKRILYFGGIWTKDGVKDAFVW